MEPLISCEWLINQIDQGTLPADVVIIDVSWASTRDAEEDYIQGHIPGAFYLNVMEADHTVMYPRNLPDPSAFQSRIQDLGVNSDSQLILYSNTDNSSFFMSCRAWWTFKLFGHEKVSILDGGWKKWTALGGPETIEIPQVPASGNFTVSRIEKYIQSYDNMLKIVESQGVQVCDSRPRAKFSGSDSTGHIKGAISLPASQLVDSNEGVLKSVDLLKQDFQANGIDPSKPLVSYCFSGMSSCSLAFAAILCGMDASVYHGGFTEWNKRGDKQLIDDRD